MQAPFYPNGTDKISLMGMAFTVELQSIPVVEPEFTSSYYLGWMRWENLPLQYHVSRSTFEDGILTFTDVTKPENVPVGFSIHNDNGIDIYKWAYSGVKFNGTKWVNIDYAYSSNASRYFYLPNNLDINVLSWGRLRLIFLAMSEDRTVVLEKIISDVPYADFAAGNNMTAYIGDGGSFNGQTFTVTKDDISNHAIFQKTINGTVFDIVLAAYTIPYNRDCNFNNNVNEFAAVHPMVKIHTTDDIPYVSGVTNPVQFQFADDCRWGSGGYRGQGFYSNWSGAVDSLTAFNNSGVYDWCGGFVGSFKVSDLPQGVINLIVPDDATFYVRGIGRNDIFIIGRVLTYDEILHCLSLLPRMKESEPNRYEQNASYWYGHVDYETNEFLGDLVNGSQVNKLVDWQLLGHNINENEFKEEDVPEYNPEPEDDEEDEGNIDYNTNIPAGISAFVSNYIVTASEVGNIGSDLWTKVAQPDTSDMIKNFFVFKQSDDPTKDYYELSASNIIDYFVSLKYFPFDLTQYGYKSATNTITIGMGTEAINLSPSVAYLTESPFIILDGGTVNIPAGYFKYEGDERVGCFLDHEPNTTVSVYIPYCGTVELSPSVVMGSSLELKYAVDINTGGCQAIIRKIYSNEVKYPIACINGTVGFEMLLTSNNAQTVGANAQNAYSNFLIDNAQKGVGILKSGLGGLVNASSGNSQNNSSNVIEGMIENGLNVAFDASRFTENIPEMMATSPLRMGSNSTLCALMSPQTAYVQIRHHTPELSGYGNVGYVVDKYLPISSTNGMGFVQIINPKLNGLKCTKEEVEMIRSMLQNGIWT